MKNKKTKGRSKTPIPASDGTSISIADITFDKRIAIIAALMALVPTIDQYHRVSGWFVAAVPWFEGLKTSYLVYLFDAVFLYLPIPLLAIVLLFRENPRKYGMQLGNWREGLKWTAGGCAFATVALIVFVFFFDLEGFYGSFFYHGDAAPSWGDHFAMVLLNLILMFAWEFMWRGFVLFGLAERMGAGPAILIQSVPFGILHFGKPFIETLVSPFIGIFFGIVAWRTGSFFYPVLLHTYLFVLMNLIATGVFR